MKRVPIRSSMAREVGYENGLLEVMFMDGTIGTYSGVPPQTHQALMTSPSFGRSLSQMVKSRPDLYRFTKTMAKPSQTV